MNDKVASNTSSEKNLEISSFTEEGWGLSSYTRPDGKEKSVAVAFTMPQDVVLVKELFRKRKASTDLQANVSSFIQKSPNRIEGRCKHFTHCGGCRWQHVPYEMQLLEKEKRIKDLFSPLLIEPSSFSFFPIISSPDAWFYRNKMEYTFSQDKDGRKYLGMILNGTRGKVFTLEECFLVDPWFCKALSTVRNWWESSNLTAYHHSTNQGSLRTLTVRHGLKSGDRMVMLTVSGNPDFALHKKDIASFVSSLKAAIIPEDGAHLSILLCIHQIAKGRPTQMYEMILDGPDFLREEVVITTKTFSKTLEFHISPRAFFQPNTKQASVLYSKALELAEIQPDQTVYDLYCGIGIFGMCAAHFAKEVLAIELACESVCDANANSSRLDLRNFHIYEGDVGKILALKKQQNELPPADVVIVDPPRAGLDARALLEILALSCKKIVYVSCNPKSQAENAKTFIEGGYRITAIQPVDQFPQTIHVENIVIFEKSCG